MCGWSRDAPADHSFTLTDVSSHKLLVLLVVPLWVTLLCLTVTLLRFPLSKMGVLQSV